METMTQGIKVEKLHTSGETEKQWRFEYDGRVYHIFDSRHGKLVKDDADEVVAARADNLKEAVGKTVHARPDADLKRWKEAVEQEIAVSTVDTVDGLGSLIGGIQNADIPEITRDHLLRDAWSKRDTLERKRQFREKRAEVYGMHLVEIDVELTDRGSWAVNVERYRVFDQTNTAYILLDTEKRDFEQLEADLEDYGLDTMFEWEALTPREKHGGQYEGFDDKTGLLQIEKNAVGDSVRAYKGNAINFKGPHRAASGAFLYPEEPGEQALEHHVSKAKRLIRESVDKEFERIKAIKFDLDSADGS
jgi:hypothetical protein